jgi:hypothetical protein
MDARRVFLLSDDPTDRNAIGGGKHPNHRVSRYAAGDGAADAASDPAPHAALRAGIVSAIAAWHLVALASSRCTGVAS